MTDPVEETPFVGVPAPLRRNLERRGFTELTRIQSAVISAESEGRNLRLSSQTGSGKTVALGFALFAALDAEQTKHNPRALIIVPTRELANQVRNELGWLFEGCPGGRVEVVTGGTDIRAEQRRLRTNPGVVVGTPGRLLDHTRSGALDLSNVREVVLDEADQMLDMGFKDDLDALVERLPAERRSHLVSATFPDVLRRLAAAFQPDPLLLEGTALGVANADISHVAHLVLERDRYDALINVLLAHHGSRCLVFVQRRVDAAKVAEMLAADGFAASPLSGDLPQAQRNRTLAAFKAGTIRILVATDVAARGLHIDDVALVVHGDLPHDSEVYTHRSGRTGRAGQQGSSVLLVVPHARRRVEQLLHQARVRCEWQPVPSIAKINKAVVKQGRRAFHAELASAVEQPELVDAGELQYAEQLVANHDPAKVIAVLLRMSQPSLPTQPRQVFDPPQQKPIARPKRELVTSGHAAIPHHRGPARIAQGPKAGAAKPGNHKGFKRPAERIRGPGAARPGGRGPLGYSK